MVLDVGLVRCVCVSWGTGVGVFWVYVGGVRCGLVNGCVCRWVKGDGEVSVF